MNNCRICMKTRDRINHAVRELLDTVAESLAANNDVDIIRREPEPEPINKTEGGMSGLRKVELVRVDRSDDGTFGVLLVDGKAQCVTYELPWLDNARNVSCIPTGTYKARWRTDSSRGALYELESVPGRTAIQLHSGNTMRDTQGCILYGTSFGRLSGQRAVLASRDAMTAFHVEMKQEPFELIVRNA